MSAPYGLRSREWNRVLAFADAVRQSTEPRGTTLSFDEDGIAHLRGEYGDAQRAAFGFTAKEAAALRSRLAKAGRRLSPDEAEGALAAAIAALDDGATFDELAADAMPRSPADEAAARARKAANKRAQRDRWKRERANACPTCGRPSAPCRTSCASCIKAALERKAARRENLSVAC